MRVYHGTTIELEKPLVHIGRNNLDFGKGFYITPIEEQAASWACRPANKNKAHWLNAYELDYNDIIKKFQTKVFSMYDEEWLDFILACRQGNNIWEQYDLIEGGIANDRIFNTIELYASRFISKEETLSRLIYEKPNLQICITNQEVINQHLHFIDSINI